MAPFVNTEARSVRVSVPSTQLESSAIVLSQFFCHPAPTNTSWIKPICLTSLKIDRFKYFVSFLLCLNYKTIILFLLRTLITRCYYWFCIENKVATNKRNMPLSYIGISGSLSLASWLGSNLRKNILNFSSRSPFFHFETELPREASVFYCLLRATLCDGSGYGGHCWSSQSYWPWLVGAVV